MNIIYIRLKFKNVQEAFKYISEYIRKFVFELIINILLNSAMKAKLMVIKNNDIRKKENKILTFIPTVLNSIELSISKENFLWYDLLGSSK